MISPVIRRLGTVEMLLALCCVKHSKFEALSPFRAVSPAHPCEAGSCVTPRLGARPAAAGAPGAGGAGAGRAPAHPLVTFCVTFFVTFPPGERTLRPVPAPQGLGSARGGTRSKWWPHSPHTPPIPGGGGTPPKPPPHRVHPPQRSAPHPSPPSFPPAPLPFPSPPPAQAGCAQRRHPAAGAAHGGAPGTALPAAAAAAAAGDKVCSEPR